MINMTKYQEKLDKQKGKIAHQKLMLDCAAVLEAFSKMLLPIESLEMIASTSALWTCAEKQVDNLPHETTWSLSGRLVDDDRAYGTGHNNHMYLMYTEKGILIAERVEERAALVFVTPGKLEEVFVRYIKVPEKKVSFLGAQVRKIGTEMTVAELNREFGSLPDVEYFCDHSRIFKKEQ